MISINETGCLPDRSGAAIDPHVSDIVMGLHWGPLGSGPHVSAGPADLDAICVLSATNGSVVEIVGPGRLRSADGSVLHTGDSRTGASIWDDERIFVFLRALPDAVAAVTFGVVSANGRAFCDIPAAACHISDHSTDDHLLEVELTALGEVTHCYVATLARTLMGWTIHAGTPLRKFSGALPSLADPPYTACNPL